jgi:hypothetical protein
MKKIILSIAMGLFGLTAHAQTKMTSDEQLKLSGLELQTYTKHHYAGLGLTIGGSGLGLLGVNLIANSTYQVPVYSPTYFDINTGQPYNYITGYKTEINRSKRISGYTLSIIGGVASLIGTYYTLEAPIHIKRAGLILNGNGVGVKIKL